MIKFKEYLKESKETWLGTPDHNYKRQYIAPEDIIDDAEKNLHRTPKITPDESTAAKSYSDKNDKIYNKSEKIPSAYKAINNYHRGIPNELEHAPNSPETIENIKAHTKHLDSLISKHKTKNNIHVWRGTTGILGKKDSLDHLNPGDIFHDKGYVSTTISPRKARQFGEKYKDPYDPMPESLHVAHIKVPKGSKALSMNHHDLGVSSEHEVLLPRNSKFKYEGKTEHMHDYYNRKLIVHHLTHIPEGK